jgi:hypothetical protein
MIRIRACYRFADFAKFILALLWTDWQPGGEIGSNVTPGNFRAISVTMLLRPICFGRFNLAIIVNANVSCSQD